MVVSDGYGVNVSRSGAGCLSTGQLKLTFNQKSICIGTIYVAPNSIKNDWDDVDDIGEDKTMTKEEKTKSIIYLHHCYQCNKRWDSKKKSSECPRCGHPHICKSNEFCLTGRR